MMDLDVALLRTFVTLAENRSFTQTAKQIGRTQSATSMQVARLEQLLDCRLFKRDKRNVSLTPDGERLLGYARNIVALNDALISRFREPDIRGTIRFGSPEDFATYYLPDILARFTAAHPRVGLNVTCDLTLTLIHDFERDKFDLIVIKQAPGHVYPGAVPLWRERLVWAGAATKGRAPRFSEVVRARHPLPLVLSPAPCVYRKRAIDALDHAGVRWKACYISPSFAGVLAAVRAGLGFAILPRAMLSAGLIPLDASLGWPKLPDAELCLLARAGSGPAVQALAAFIREQVIYKHI